MLNLQKKQAVVQILANASYSDLCDIFRMACEAGMINMPINTKCPHCEEVYTFNLFSRTLEVQDIVPQHQTTKTDKPTTEQLSFEELTTE